MYQAQEKVDVYDQRIEELSQSEKYREPVEKLGCFIGIKNHTALTSISGIGPLPGAAILSEIRDISCFSSADKLVSYAGLNSKVKRSGETIFEGIHMSRRGSPCLRRAIWMACANAVQCDPTFHPYYTKKAAGYINGPAGFFGLFI